MWPSYTKGILASIIYIKLVIQYSLCESWTICWDVWIPRKGFNLWIIDLPFGHEISLPLTFTLSCDKKILVANQCLIGGSIWILEPFPGRFLLFDHILPINASLDDLSGSFSKKIPLIWSISGNNNRFKEDLNVLLGLSFHEVHEISRNPLQNSFIDRAVRERDIWSFFSGFVNVLGMNYTHVYISAEGAVIDKTTTTTRTGFLKIYIFRFRFFITYIEYLYHIIV